MTLFLLFVTTLLLWSNTCFAQQSTATERQVEIEVRYNLHLKNSNADFAASVRLVESLALQRIQKRMNGLGANKNAVEVEGFKENPFIAVHAKGCAQLPNQDQAWPKCAHVRSTVLLNVLDPAVDIAQKLHYYKTAIIQESLEWIDQFNEQQSNSMHIEYLSPVPVSFMGIVILIEPVVDNDDGGARRSLLVEDAIKDDNDMRMDANEQRILEQALLNKGQIRYRKEFDVTAVNVVSQHPRPNPKSDDKPDNNYVQIHVSGLTRNAELDATPEHDADEKYKQDYQKDLAISTPSVLKEAQRLAAGDAGYPETTYFDNVKLSTVTPDDYFVLLSGIMADEKAIDIVAKEFEDPVEEEDFQWFLFVVAGGILLLLVGALTCACVCGNTTHPVMQDAEQHLLSSQQQDSGVEPAQGDDYADEPLQAPNEKAPNEQTAGNLDIPYSDIKKEEEEKEEVAY